MLSRKIIKLTVVIGAACNGLKRLYKRGKVISLINAQLFTEPVTRHPQAIGRDSEQGRDIRRIEVDAEQGDQPHICRS